MNRKKIKPTKFGDLPDEILGHICSFLPIKDLIQVVCLSKRYSKLHLSTISFSLDESSDGIRISTCDRRKQLLGSLDRFLIRRGCNKLQCFRFSWCYHDHDQGKPESCCPNDLKSWLVKFIDNVVRCNVNELHLKMNIDSTQRAFMEFPAIRCESLRHLSVKGMYTNVKTPLSSSFPNLERLELTLVCIPDEKIFKWISDSCKRIKELRLEDIYGLGNKTASIESSSLKSFTSILNKDYSTSNYNLYVPCENLEDACIVLGKPCLNGKYDGELCFTSPNLKKLKWSGNMMKCQNLGEFNKLEKAEVELDSEVKDFDNVSKLFSSIHRAKDLVLTETSLMCLFHIGLTPARVLLHNVCRLRIRRLCLTNDEVPALVSLLEEMPQLDTLEIEGGTNGYDYNSCLYGRRYWITQQLNFKRLKEVSIELSEGTNGIVLAQHLLDYARNLQKLVIHHLPEQYYKVRRHKWNVKSDAKVMFHERETE